MAGGPEVNPPNAIPSANPFNTIPLPAVINFRFTG
jgi:hypothetical protein